MCLEYLIKSTDVALRLLWEGWREGVTETDKKRGMESANRKAMDGMKERTKK